MSRLSYPFGIFPQPQKTLQTWEPILTKISKDLAAHLSYGETPSLSGEVWTKGEAIKRKAVLVPNLPDTDTLTFKLYLVQVERILHVNAGAHKRDGAFYYPLPVSGVDYHIEDDNLIITTGSDWSDYGAVFVFMYI